MPHTVVGTCHNFGGEKSGDGDGQIRAANTVSVIADQEMAGSELQMS